MLSTADQARVSAYRLLVADVYELAATSRRSSQPLAAAKGVTTTQWHTLSVLSDQPATVPVAARRLGVSRQAVQRTVDLLIESGLVETVANAAHRSSPVVRLTTSGQELLADLNDSGDAYRAKQIRSVAVDDLRGAQATLRAVLNALGSDSRDGTD